MGMIAVVVVPVIRLSVKRFLLRYPWFRRRVLILGAGKTGRLIKRALVKEPNYGYDIMGFLDDDPKKTGTVIDDLKVHRGVDRAAIPEVMPHHGCDHRNARRRKGKAPASHKQPPA
jgi:FlaA1/EpsC-like NDP-sugar epimerase